MQDATLKANAIKTTRCREAILQVLRAAQAPMTAEDVYNAVHSQVHLSVSTAYRTLATLSQKDIVLKELSQDGKTYFRLNDHRHCHFLRCTSCGEVLALPGCPIEALEQTWAQQTGYQITGHRLEVMGLCPKCAAKAAGKKEEPKHE